MKTTANKATEISNSSTITCKINIFIIISCRHPKLPIRLDTKVQYGVQLKPSNSQNYQEYFIFLFTTEDPNFTKYPMVYANQNPKSYAVEEPGGS